MASLAAFNVGFDVLLDLGPPEFAEYQLLRLLYSWVAGSDVVVTSGNDLALEGGFLGNIDSSVVVEHPFLSGYSSVMGEGRGDAGIP